MFKIVGLLTIVGVVGDCAVVNTILWHFATKAWSVSRHSDLSLVHCCLTSFKRNAFLCFHCVGILHQNFTYVWAPLSLVQHEARNNKITTCTCTHMWVFDQICNVALSVRNVWDMVHVAQLNSLRFLVAQIRVSIDHIAQSRVTFEPGGTIEVFNRRLAKSFF